MVGKKPAHVDFVLQLSWMMCSHTPVYEQTEERYRINLCAEHHR